MALALRRPLRGPAPATTTEDAAVQHGRSNRPVGRTRVAAAHGARAVGSLMLALARVVRLLVGIVVAIIIAAILLRVLGANPSNAIVRDIHDVGRVLVGPFNNVFSISHAKVSMAVNWGLAALVYLVIGGFIARMIVRAAPRGVSRPRNGQLTAD